MNRHLLFLCFLIFTTSGYSQESKDQSSIIFIYDASGSMWGQIEGKTKMEIATTVLGQSIRNLPADQPIGLVAYGHRNEGDCQDVEFLVNMQSTDKNAVLKSLDKIKPLGRTPLAFSALQVIEKIKTSDISATIILITDGIESCGGNICEVIQKAKSEGITFKLHIIGFGLKPGETDQLKCAAEAGEGNYYDAGDAGQLSEVLNQATSETVEDPFKNLSVYALKNGAPIDAMVQAYPSGSKSYDRSVRTYQDTGRLDLTPGTYDLVFTPLENSDVSSITVKDVAVSASQIVHRTVSFDAAELIVMTTNNGEGWDAVVRIYIHDTGKSATGGRTYGRPTPFELTPGVYNVEVGAMRIEGISIKHTWEKIEVSGGASHNVTHNFESGIAMIGANKGNERVDVTVNIVDMQSGKHVAGGRTYTGPNSNPKKFILNPGVYEVTLKGLKDDISGVIKTFKMEVRAGQTFEQITTF